MLLLTLGGCALFEFKSLYPCPDTGVDTAYGAVAVGASHACAARLEDGVVECWGDVPAAMPDGAWTTLTAGDGFTCGLEDDALTCVGDIAAPPTGDALVVDAGDRFVCLVDSSGVPACWGEDAPTLGGSTVDTVSAGAIDACAVDATKQSIACAGADTTLVTTVPAGVFATVDVGDGAAVGVTSLGANVAWGALPAGPAGTFEMVSVGADVACGIQHSGTQSIACWGAGPALAAPAGVYAAVSVALDGQAACALGTNGRVDCWGADGDARAEGP